jgi:hypothetical protein
MPEALISSTTSSGPGEGSGKSRYSILLSPTNTIPFIAWLLVIFLIYLNDVLIIFIKIIFMSI